MIDESYLRELGIKIGKIEGKLDQILDIVPIVNNHAERIARLEESLRSSHKRIRELEESSGRIKREIYLTVGMMVSAVQFIFFIIEKAGGR